MNELKMKEKVVGQSPYILVVDDDETILRTVHRIVVKAGYECLLVKNAIGAIAVLEDIEIDVIVSDIKMPDMNGLELTKKVVQNYNCDIIIMTGYADNFSFEDALSAGANDFIKKPFSDKELVARLKRVLRERSLLANLNQQRSLLKKAQEIGKIGSWELDLRNNELEWTEENYKIFGLPMGQKLTYKTFLDCVHPDDRSLVDLEWKKGIPKNDYDIEHRVLLNGQVKWVREKASFDYDKAGECVRAIGFSQDITEQKNAEIILQKSHQQLERQTHQQAITLENERKRFYFVLENLPAYVCLLSTDYSIPYVNRYFRKQFGDPKGKPCYSAMHQKTNVCDQCQTFKVLETNQPLEWDWFDAPDNKIYHVYAYPFIDWDDSKMVLQLGVNITERIEAENKLKIYSKELEMRNQELQDFAYVASHDLQEPLRKIQTFGDRIRNKCNEQLDDKGKDYLMRMENAAKRMRTLITALLAYSRVSTKGIPFKPVDLNNLLEQVINDLDVQIVKKNAQVEVGELSTIEADTNQMGQLFQNLISNAIKFNDKPNPIIRIHGKTLDYKKPITGSLSTTLWYQILIEDNGIGFDQEYADRIFTPFQRLHGGHKYEGTGIGLSICKKVVVRHRGTIKARSNPNTGSAFIITLPVKQKN